jgi:hypothetical protein
MCLLTPQQETSLARPRPVFRARAPLPPVGARLRSARYARHRSASPQRGARAEEGKAIYRNIFTPTHGERRQRQAEYCKQCGDFRCFHIVLIFLIFLVNQNHAFWFKQRKGGGYV